jgi:archaellum biogenesis protein FlaJ (TadC family)
MDGKYLASNIGPLKTINDGKVFIAINDLMNTVRFENVELVAYSINGKEVQCLFKRSEGFTLFIRRFNFYKSTGNVDDYLKLIAEHGIGIADYDIDDFLKLRDFYLQNKEVPAEV